MPLSNNHPSGCLLGTTVSKKVVPERGNLSRIHSPRVSPYAHSPSAPPPLGIRGCSGNRRNACSSGGHPYPPAPVFDTVMRYLTSLYFVRGLSAQQATQKHILSSIARGHGQCNCFSHTFMISLPSLRRGTRRFYARVSGILRTAKRVREPKRRRHDRSAGQHAASPFIPAIPCRQENSKLESPVF